MIQNIQIQSPNNYSIDCYMETFILTSHGPWEEGKDHGVMSVRQPINFFDIVNRIRHIINRSYSYYNL